MRAVLPKSLLFLVATGVVYLLQVIPITGIFLMFALAMFWSVLLVNAGMIGIAVEALTGRVALWWLVLPIAFYGGYWGVTARDHATLRALTASYDAANARVTIPFDSARQALVFEKDEGGPWLTQNYALPVAYSVNANFPEGFRSHRMMDSKVCARIRETPALQAASVHTFGFHDGDAIADRRMEGRFCDLSMPEQPEHPLVRVSRKEEKLLEGWLPVTRITTTVTMPDGRPFLLLGGVAAPLSWMPMPVMGCALNSGGPSWNCQAAFWRHGYTPIVSGHTQFNRDLFVLAQALGLKPVAIADRQSSDPAPVLAKIAIVEQDTLARQLANIDAMIADPVARGAEWQVGVLQNHPDELAARADAIMTGIERAAMAGRAKRYQGRDSGRILAGLIVHLTRDRFVMFGPRLLAAYAAAGDDHWLWEAEPLLRRLGDLGPAALPYLLNRRASSASINGAGIEGLCRVGADGRADAEPALVAIWNGTRDGFERDARTELFVAMRRVGVSPPPLAEDKRNQLAQLQVDWADISPQSPPRVCAVRAEEQARREEKYRGTRHTNLD